MSAAICFALVFFSTSLSSSCECMARMLQMPVAKAITAYVTALTPGEPLMGASGQAMRYLLSVISRAFLAKKPASFP